MPPPPYFSIPKVFPHQRWGKLDSGPSFKRAAHRLGRSSRPDSEGSPGGGDGKGGRGGAGPPVLPPTRQTDLAWLPGTAAPPTNHHTHPCPQGLSKRGHARLGGDGPSSWASGGWALWDTEVGRVPKLGWAPWHQCPTLAERRGEFVPIKPSQMMGPGVPPWPGWHQPSSRWHLS